MNRPLKFRIYSFLDKTFHYFTLEEGIPQGIAGGTSEPQQYTGLTDKNNNPIYEGDVVKYKTWTGYNGGSTEENQTQVQFNNGAYIPRYINDECEDSWYSFKVYDLEIIGNQFEHSELLK